MEDNVITATSFRQFLLGKVDEKERERIEILFLTDSVTRDRVLSEEQHLLDDYLEDSLNVADKDSFLTQYAYDSAQRRKLRIAETIRDWAVAENRALAANASYSSTWSRLFTKMRAKPMFVVPITAVALSLIGVIALWVYNGIHEGKKVPALEQEIAQLNKSTSSPQLSLNLRPGVVRSAQPQNPLLLGPSVQVIELRLLWNHKKDYPKYQVILSKVDNKRPITIRDLLLERDGQTVNVKLPTHILTSGLYEIQLTGIAADGSSSGAEEYEFVVTR